MSQDAAVRPLLRQRNYLALLGGQLISISGERLTYLALVGLLLEHTGHFKAAGQSSLLLWLLGMAQMLPVLLFSPFAGAWVDRWNLKRVLVVSDTLRAVLVMLIPAVYLATHSVWPVNLLVFALFTCNVFFMPAKSAIVPEIVPGAQLLPANTLLAGAGLAGTAAGILGSWVVDHWGWAAALYVNGVTYLVSVASLLLIAYLPAAHHATLAPISMRSYLREVGDGWRLVRSTPVLVLVLICLAAMWLGGGFVHVAGMQHLQRAARALAGMERVGVLMAVVAVGSGLGIWWVTTWGRGVRRHVQLGAGLLLAAGGLLCFALSTRFAVFAGAALLVGLGVAPVIVLPETMIQEGTEGGQRGRVFSARDFLMRLTFLGAQSVAGLATPFLGAGTTLLVGAGLLALIGVAAMRMGRRAAAPVTAGSR